ncbi:MAG: long-chain fatty acid--CoA ligase [bacterium]
MESRVWHAHNAPQVPHTIDYERITLPEAFDRTVKRFPDRTALVMMGKKISYRSLHDAVCRMADALRNLGLEKGDKVSLILPNMPQVVIANYAVWRAGGVVVMNNPLYTERELTHQLNDSESKIAIILDVLVPRLLSIKPNTGVETIIACHIRDYLPFPLKQLFPFVKKELHRRLDPSEGVLDFETVLQSGQADARPDHAAFEDMGALLYTGGTTGVSKGVMLTHAALCINVQQAKALLHDMEDGNETVIGIMPVFHSAGFTFGMNNCIFRGFNHVLIPRPDPDALLKAILKYRPAIFGGVPTLYVGLLNHPKLPAKSELSFIKGCVSGAAPLAMETIREWERKVGAQIIEVFGMTEMSPVSHANPWGGVCKAGSVGIPYPDTDCRIVDVKTGTRDMPVGEAGEILVKGPQCMTGYFNKPEETANALKDGWFYTGDIGYMDEEGYLYISDRKKDMIIAGGYNIYPREIDEILYEIPNVAEACAIGIPDPYRGETVKAFVVVTPGETLTEETIIAHCKRKLAAYKVPKQIAFMDELPKSAIGKILRRELREMELESQK